MKVFMAILFAPAILDLAKYIVNSWFKIFIGIYKAIHKEQTEA